VTCKMGVRACDLRELTCVRWVLFFVHIKRHTYTARLSSEFKLLVASRITQQKTHIFQLSQIFSTVGVYVCDESYKLNVVVV